TISNAATVYAVGERAGVGDDAVEHRVRHRVNGGGVADRGAERGRTGVRHGVGERRVAGENEERAGIIVGVHVEPAAGHRGGAADGAELAGAGAAEREATGGLHVVAGDGAAK